jgi:hypothetical protein
MSSDLADHAYGHCLAVLLETNLAEEAARDALRRGSWTTMAVLAHARYAALAGDAPGLKAPVDLATAELSDIALTAIARRLTASRPPLERAIVDLHGRHGLDRLRFARTLGLDPTTAAARRAAVAETWSATLDPALLARLGPGECEGLAAILAGRGLATPAADPDGIASEPARTEAAQPLVTPETLLAAVPAVAGHVDGCAVCQDRLRAMISVADLVTGIPLETAPPEVRVVLPRGGRHRRRPASLPPPVEAKPGRRAVRRLLVAGAAVAGLAAIVAAGVVVTDHLGRHSTNDRVLALTKLASTNALSVDRATVLVPGGSFVLMNLSRRPLRWQANSPVAWLSLDPGSGSLGPGAQTRLQPRIQGNPPGIQAGVTVAITADDGSATAVRATTAGTALPDVAASLANCVVTATAEAPQGIADVVLHWRPLPPPSGSPLDHLVAMTKGDTGYVAPLPAHSATIQWWVGVVDNGGDQVETTIQVLGPGSCS